VGKEGLTSNTVIDHLAEYNDYLENYYPYYDAGS